ncbi:MAG: aldolase/citrate lyase family protein [Betaproteobacteria bacterium]
MKCYPNHAKRQLANGKLALGMGVRQSRTVEIAAIAKTCGFDWLFIDMEHGTIDLDTAASIANAALPLGITPLLRVPGKEHHHSSRMLDNGIQGIVIPHVESAEEAAAAVSYCRYPPYGTRSISGAQPQFGFETVPLSEMVSDSDSQTMVIVMIESPEAVEKVDEILKVPGIDAVMVGTSDLTLEMGIPGQLEHPKIKSSIKKIIASCHKNKIHPGIGGVHELNLVKEYIDMGMRFILGGNDLRFMMSAGEERAQALRKMQS